MLVWRSAVALSNVVYTSFHSSNVAPELAKEIACEFKTKTKAIIKPTAM